MYSTTCVSSLTGYKELSRASDGPVFCVCEDDSTIYVLFAFGTQLC